MKKAILVLAIVFAVSTFVCTSARADWVTGTITQISNGWGSSMVCVNNGSASTWYVLSSTSEKQMLALAMYAQANSKQVQVGVVSPVQGSTAFAIYVLP